MGRATPWIVACAACAWLAVALHNGRRQTVELARTRSELSTTNLNASKEIVHLEQELAEARKELAAVKRKIAASERATSPDGAPGRVDYNAMRNDPVYGGVWRREQMRSDQFFKGDALAALKLPPDKLAKLRNLLVDEDTAWLDATEAAKEAGLGPRETAQATEQAEAEAVNEIKQLIGADAYAEFERNSMAGAFVPIVENGIAADLAIQGIPLSPEQIAPLTRIYADANNRLVNPSLASSSASLPSPATGLDARSQWILDSSSSLLTPAQLQAMQESLLLDQEIQKYYQQGPAPKKGQ